MKKIMIAILCIGALFAGLSLSAAKTEDGVQTTCPVMDGRPINKSLYVDYEGKRIYVCCAACIEKVKADPKYYIKKMEEKGVKFEEIKKEKKN